MMMMMMMMMIMMMISHAQFAKKKLVRRVSCNYAITGGL